MRPLPVLIFVLVAVIAALTVVFLNRSPSDDGGAAAVTPDKPIAAVQQGVSDDRITAPKEDVARADVEAPTDTDELGDPEAGPSTARVVGTVVNQQDRPVEGATVKLSTDAMMGESLAMDWFANREQTGKFLSTTTDAKGQYAFRGVEAGRNYYVMASHPDFASVQEEGLRVPKQGEVRAPDLVLRAGSILKGYVTAVDGAPIADAVIDVDSAYMMSFEMKSPDRLTAKTDGQGYFEFRNVSPGPRIVSAWADGYERQIHHDVVFTGEEGEVREKNFTLGLGHPIAGRVFGPDNEGVKGANVIAINYGSNTSSRGESLTDDDGNFQIDGLAQGSYILMVQAKGYRMARQNRVQIGDVNLQIEMIRQGSLTGRVFDASSSAPIRDFKVQLLHVNTAIPVQGTAPVSYEPTEVKETFKGAEDGVFTLVGVDPGTFALKVTANGYASRVSDSFTVVDGQMNTPLAVGLSKGGSIKGRVVDAVTGKGISGVQISSRDGDLPDAMALDPFLENMVASRATERKVRSGADGMFELKLLNPGRYRLQLEHPEYTADWAQGLVVVEGQTNDIGALQMKGGGTVSGKVVDAAGKPCVRCVVRMFSELEQDQYQARTDNEGRYTIPHVRPGDYRLTATRASGAGGDAIDQIIDQSNSELRVRVLEGQTSNRDLALGN